MKGQELDWGKCPECGEELLDVSDSEENFVMCTECGRTFPEPPLGPVTKKKRTRKAKKEKELRMPFGKHKGKAISVVFAEEPGYLCWFYDAVDGNEELKQAIAAMPEFPARLAKYRERKGLKDKTLEQRIEEVVARMFAVEPTPQETDDLCDRLFNGPEAEDAANPKITKSVHYGNYIQSGENLSCEKAGDERYRFQVREKGRAYEPWIVTPATDLSEVPTDVLEEMDAQMYYCGESDERDAKFSETRKHVQEAIWGRERRSPS